MFKYRIRLYNRFQNTHISIDASSSKGVVFVLATFDRNHRQDALYIDGCVCYVLLLGVCHSLGFSVVLFVFSRCLENLQLSGRFAHIESKPASVVISNPNRFITLSALPAPKTSGYY